MSAATKKKAMDKREAVQKRKSKLTHLQRQERYQQLKNERLQREREEYESLTPEQKRRRDLKEEKKARKSARGKHKVRGGSSALEANDPPVRCCPRPCSLCKILVVAIVADEAYPILGVVF